MGFEKPQITPRRRIEVPEAARREARAAMGGEATRTAALPPATAMPTVSAAALPAPVRSAKPAAAPAPIRALTRTQKPPRATVLAPAAEIPLHTVQIAKFVVQEIKMNLLLAAPGPDTPTTIKNYLEAAHRHYDAYLRTMGTLPSTK